MVINSLKIRLSFETFDNNASFEPHTIHRHVVNAIKGFTQFVKTVDIYHIKDKIGRVN
uniref:Uncharacterized protein n=1 Tax=Rhizophagus irregularis (strain DAOM 181602 / DAOM 197198 / MUCL 43194) TaxID=747089 RepID=U9TU45_RHIID